MVAEAIDSLELKGKRGRVAASRLVALHEPTAWHGASTFVGRADEINVLRRAQGALGAWRGSAFSSRCSVPPAFGKSRCFDEFLSRPTARARARDAGLSYGEGITYYPVVAVLKQMLGPSPK